MRCIVVKVCVECVVEAFFTDVVLVAEIEFWVAVVLINTEFVVMSFDFAVTVEWFCRENPVVIVCVCSVLAPGRIEVDVIIVVVVDIGACTKKEINTSMYSTATC